MDEVGRRRVMTGRRAQIAEAGIRLLATRGVRALTHRAIDEDLGLAPGSTSYYARTRHDLITLIVEHLSRRAFDDLATQQFPHPLTPQTAAAAVVAALDATMARADDHRARLILLLECRGDPELQAALATRPRVRENFVAAAAAMLRRLGATRAEADAHDLAGLLDALLMQRIIRTAAFDEREVIAAYLTGLPKNTRG